VIRGPACLTGDDAKNGLGAKLGTGGGQRAHNASIMAGSLPVIVFPVLLSVDLKHFQKRYLTSSTQTSRNMTQSLWVKGF
jgi:hypothetical protein